MTIEDVAILYVQGLGVRGVAHLIDHYGSAEAVYSAPMASLIADAGLRKDIAENISLGEGISVARREVEYCRKHGIFMVAATDAEYPALLRETGDRPHILFVKGNIEALSRPMLSMVGTREMSPSGQHITNRLIEGLASTVDSFTLVSGIAYGVDAACHRAAIAHHIPSVAVLANALPEVNPTPHRQLAEDILKNGGALISELTSQSRQNGKHFIARNRIIAGLSMGVVVVESPASGGALSTADLADGYGRAVMAVPGRVTDVSSFGTNNLIRSGKARLVMTAQDIICDMDWERYCIKTITETMQQNESLSLAPDEEMVFEVFKSVAQPDVQQLINATGYTIGELMMILMGLELKGLIRTLPGQRYERI
ncbi:MAG: DNA-processing protein DprA [Alistipes sp.]|nr:DNA-processing protein DprA [Alistipes sp.]